MRLNYKNVLHIGQRFWNLCPGLLLAKLSPIQQSTLKPV